MGMYYGLFNATTGEGVSAYWKGCPPSDDEMRKIIRVLGWQPGQELISGSYCDRLVYDWDTNEWICSEEDFTGDLETEYVDGDAEDETETETETRDGIEAGDEKLSVSIYSGYYILDFADSITDKKQVPVLIDGVQHNFQDPKYDVSATFYFA